MSGRSIRNESQFVSRMIQKSGLIIILIALLQAACSSNTDNAPSQPIAPSSAERSETLSYEVRTVEKRDSGCIQTQAQCSYVRFVYPELTGGPTRAKEAINRAVNDFLLQGREEGLRFNTIDEAMHSFIADYQKFKNEFPDAPYIYTDDKEVKVAYQTPRIMSLDFNHTWFTGGAHPNMARTLASFDATTGEKFKLSDLLIDDYKARLDEIGEMRFREVRLMTADMNLSEAGFNFKEGKFTLNDNFHADKDGIKFYFNPYEIAAYAAGPTELTLNYSDIKPLIKPDGPLADFAK